MNKNDLKGFLNLIYLKLPNSIKTIDEDAFDEVPCLNYENISDHPIIREIKRKKYENIHNIKKKNNLDTILKFLQNIPSFDVPNYDFEKSNNNKEKKSKKKYENESQDEENEYEKESEYEEDEENEDEENEYDDSNENKKEKGKDKDRYEIEDKNKKVDKYEDKYEKIIKEYKENIYNVLNKIIRNKENSEKENNKKKYINNYIVNKKK